MKGRIARIKKSTGTDSALMKAGIKKYNAIKAKGTLGK
jgi:hypothetical protein